MLVWLITTTFAQNKASNSIDKLPIWPVIRNIQVDKTDFHSLLKTDRSMNARMEKNKNSQ